jgi:hypothetical protein
MTPGVERHETTAASNHDGMEHAHAATTFNSSPGPVSYCFSTLHMPSSHIRNYIGLGSDLSNIYFVWGFLSHTVHFVWGFLQLLELKRELRVDAALPLMMTRFPRRDA